MIEVKRETKETKIEISLELRGSGKSDISTGIGFFDHMLSALAKHSLMDLKLTCLGDLEIDQHHSVEDCGIALGEALQKELFPVQNIERFSSTTAVLDEAAIECDMDISNRPYLHFDLELDGKIGEFDAELVEEFFRALVQNAKITAHLHQKRGKNRHHIAEAAFKAFAHALKKASAINEKQGIPSTKGVL
jgi:imidazoleglycerol-phosphate dehydratase